MLGQNGLKITKLAEFSSMTNYCHVLGELRYLLIITHHLLCSKQRDKLDFWLSKQAKNSLLLKLTPELFLLLSNRERPIN